MKLLEQNMGQNLHDLRLDKEFVEVRPENRLVNLISQKLKTSAVWGRLGGSVG